MYENNERKYNFFNRIKPPSLERGREVESQKAFPAPFLNIYSQLKCVDGGRIFDIAVIVWCQQVRMYTLLS